MSSAKHDNARHGSASTIAISAVLALGLTALMPNLAFAEELSDLEEVSYLVFHRNAGFERPDVATDLLDGTVTIRFRRLPAAWESILSPQVASPRKQRFFRTMEPVLENGRLLGIRIRIGVGAFETKVYAKRGPMRWVLRVGELRRPPFSRGRTGVPVVPYSDLCEEDAEGHAAFASAELDFARGQFDAPCLTFHRLRTTEPSSEVASWVALREADCLLEVGEHDSAIEILESVAKAGHTPGAILLARVRIAEARGSVLSAGFDRAIYTNVDPAIQGYMGTVADEVAYREARTMLFRGDAGEAFQVLEELYARRPTSPFFVEREMLNVLRWRAVRDNAQEGHWLRTARNYLRIPPTLPAETPNLARIHEYGAHALRQIGLPKRAVQVYLHLLRVRGVTIDEPALILELAETYREAGDPYRATITMRYLLEQHPHLARSRRVLRLQGDLALGAGKDIAVGEATREMAGLVGSGGVGAQEDGDRDTQLLVGSAVRSLATEGVVSARESLHALHGSFAAGGLAAQVARDLAYAAGDCAALAEMSTPMELAGGEALLWTGACFMNRGQVDDATVYLEAARVYAAAEVALPELDSVLELIGQSAAWWTKNDGRLAKHLRRAGQSMTGQSIN